MSDLVTRTESAPAPASSCQARPLARVAPPRSFMFIRLVVRELDSDSNCRKGIFQATADHLSRTIVSHAERAWADAVVAWFADHLPRPPTLATSRRHNANNRGVCWFRDTARKHLAEARSLAAWLEDQGLTVDELHSERPGYVLYEDEFQVVVDPFGSSADGRREGGPSRSRPRHVTSACQRG